MALYTKKGYDVPSDAVRLDENSAIKFMKTIIDSWADKRDTFYIRYGPGMLSGLTMLSCTYINSHYRLRLRLMSSGRLSSYLPITVIPSVVTFIAQSIVIQQPLLIEKFTCPICLEMRSSAIQLMSSVVYPLTLGPLSGFMLAARYYTYNVPSLNKDPKSVWNLYMKLTKPIKGPLLGIIAIQALAASVITYKQSMNVATVKNKLMQMEANLEFENSN